MRRGDYPIANSPDRDRDQTNGKPPAPITPRMLVKALKNLRNNSFKGLFFTPREVAFEILTQYRNVEQDMDLLLMEVSDKLICASAAGLVGNKQEYGYYAFDLRQKGFRMDIRSELMFWLFYKKILNRKREEERKRLLVERNRSDEKRDGNGQL